MRALIGYNWSRDTKSDNGYGRISAVRFYIRGLILFPRKENHETSKRSR